MKKTKNKPLSKGGKGKEEDNFSSESVHESRTAISLSKGLRDHFGDREPTENQHHILNMTQEYSLYVVGLHRLFEWAEGLSDPLSNLSSALNHGDYSQIDMILDKIAEESPWNDQQIRDLLINMALVDHSDTHHAEK